MCFVSVPESVRRWLTNPLPLVEDDYDPPIKHRRDHSASTNIELHPSMIPFIAQFRTEEDLKGNRKVLVTFAPINHNHLQFGTCAEITNNLARNKVQHKYTCDPQIRHGFELFFYNWKKVCVHSINHNICGIM